MSGAELGLAVSVFLACAVEAVEALTIVMAVGYTRSWPSALAGVGAAVAVLAVLVGALGAALTSIPIDDLRVPIGLVLLVFGLRWLRKAILRAAGLKAMHDEREIYTEQEAEARAAGRTAGGLDGYSFSVSLQGVLLEGHEVVLIVIGFGASQHRIGLASAAAVLAILAVIGAGMVVRAPLARVPENDMKFVVGVLLSSFGIFWIGEGVGVSWPLDDASVVVIIALVSGCALAAVSVLRRREPYA